MDLINPLYTTAVSLEYYWIELGTLGQSPTSERLQEIKNEYYQNLEGRSFVETPEMARFLEMDLTYFIYHLEDIVGFDHLKELYKSAYQIEKDIVCNVVTAKKAH